MRSGEVSISTIARSLKSGLSLSCFVVASAAWGQQVPDAGSALRQQEQQRAPELPKPVSPPADRSQESVEPETSGPKVIITTFRFEGNERFTEAQLQQVVAAYLGRPLSLSDIDGVGAVVAQYYREAGWLARVVVPPQRIENGIVTLKVIEAIFGEARFSADTDKSSLPVKSGSVVDRVEARQKKGAKLHVPSVERGLLLANDLPGLSVAGSQTAGSREAETDILLQATSDPLLYGRVIADNQGARGTGAERVGLLLGLNSPLGVGDQFDFQGQISAHQQFGEISGSVPLGSDGLRLAGHFSALRYSVGLPEFRALDPRGHSIQYGADLLYPIVRASDRNIFFGVGVEQKLPYNRVVTGVISDYKITNAELRINANLFDKLGGVNGVSTFDITFIAGNLDLKGSPNQALDAATLDTQGDFQILRYRLTRDQMLGSGFSLFGAFSGQVASKNLDSAEKLYLGGPYGVRAYPVNEAGGTHGQLLNVELRWQVPVDECGCRVAAFYDWGHVEVNENNHFLGAPARNSYSLSGFGLGLEADGPFRTHLSAAVARRIGDNPNPTASGRDQDGSLHKTRFWASLSKTF